jgi:HEAT repeat protein
VKSRRWIIALLGPAAMAAPWNATAPWNAFAPWLSQSLENVACAQADIPAAAQTAGAGDSAPPQQVLSDSRSTPQEKLEAALRLVGQQTPESRQILASILNQSQNADGQLAVARALASDPNPDPNLRDTLANLVGGSQALTDAAIGALADYRDSGQAISHDVMERLIDFATTAGRSESLRGAALRALGTFADREAASTLVKMVLNTDASSTLRNAAADGLVEMTGQTTFGHDVQQWQNWWNRNLNLSPDAFRQEIVQSRAAHFEQELHRYRQLAQESANILEDMYLRVSDEKKAAVLDEYLRSAAPEIRQTGAQIVLDQQSIGAHVPDSAVALLRTMVSDSSPEVRKTVATVLYNDKQAFAALLAQLNVEPDPDVKIQIIKSLAPMQNLAAVDTLVNLLKDPSFRVRTAAADALADLGPALQSQQPNDVHKVADALFSTLEEAQGPGTQELRESCVRALASLKDPEMLPEFLQLLRGNESATVHSYALNGLGALGNNNTANAIASFLHDPDGGVRIAAIQALGKLQAPFLGDAMVAVMTDANSDKSTADAAWQSLQNWFGSMDDSQLETVAQALQEKLPDQPDKELAARQALAAQLATQGGQGDSLAETQQQIGVLQMKLVDPAHAADSFLAALKYWKATPNPQEMVIDRLTQQYIAALLAAKEYDQATTFASSNIGAHNGIERSVSAALRDEAERLASQNDAADAQALIASIDKMTNKLPDSYQGDIDALRTKLKAASH